MFCHGADQRKALVFTACVRYNGRQDHIYPQKAGGIF